MSLRLNHSVAPSNTASDQINLHPYPDILALGILLLEIELEISIDRENSNDEKNHNTNQEFLAAHDILETHRDNLTYNSVRAIQSCLHGDFLRNHARPTNTSDLLNEIDEHIVKPLIYNGMVVGISTFT